jgi:AcrR family transcriptional regulator
VKAQEPAAERFDGDRVPARLEPSGYDRVIEAAVALFAARGFSAVGIREVADRAGMVSASLYHWFDNKEALLLAIMRRGQARLNDCANAAVARLRSPEARVAALVRVHVAVHARRRHEALVVDTEMRALSSAGRAQMLPLRDAYENLWNEALRKGSDSGVFAVSNPKLTRLALLQMCSGVSTWYREDADLALAVICDEFAAMALAMLRKPSTPRVHLEGLEGPPVQHYLDLVDGHWPLSGLPVPWRSPDSQ